MRNETIIQLLIAKRVIDVDEKIPPSELTDILLHDVDKSLFSTIATVAREYFDSLSNEMRANLLVHGSIL